VAILGVITVAACLAAFFSGSALAAAKKSQAETLAHARTLQNELDAVKAKQAQLAKEAQDSKLEARAERDALKALKKKRYDERKPSAPETPVPDLKAIELERAWRLAEEERKLALEAKHTAEARALVLEKEVAALKTPKAPATEARTTEVKAAEQKPVTVREAPAIDPKVVMDLRRKLEWYRRIYLVQQKEIALEKDKTAHVRKRFLDACNDVVVLQQLAGNVDIDRLKREQAAYQATQDRATDEGDTAPETSNEAGAQA
jgi:hypothetical protein